MCRLYGFRANEPTKVECSLVQAQNALLLQDKNEESARRPADGWGIACYSNLDCEMCVPELVRHKTPAFSADHFSHHAESTYARTVVAHVRSSSVGYVDTMNSHPFGRDNWTMAHYGTIPQFDRLHRQLAEESSFFQGSRYGTTDSEQLQQNPS
jgi:glutamine amidotransferase